MNIPEIPIKAALNKDYPFSKTPGIPQTILSIQPTRINLVIHTGKTAATPIGVIIEAKRPGNKTGMVCRTSLDTKAMWELLLYYLRETVDNKNAELKHLIPVAPEHHHGPELYP